MRGTEGSVRGFLEIRGTNDTNGRSNIGSTRSGDVSVRVLRRFMVHWQDFFRSANLASTSKGPGKPAFPFSGKSRFTGFRRLRP